MHTTTLLWIAVAIFSFVDHVSANKEIKDIHTPKVSAKYIDSRLINLQNQYLHQNSKHILKEIDQHILSLGDSASLYLHCRDCHLTKITYGQIEILAKQLRNEGYFYTASYYYRYLTMSNPKGKDAWLGLIMSEAEAGNKKASQNAIVGYRQRFGETPSLFKAWIYSAQTLNDPVNALYAYQLWLAQEPNNKDVGLSLYRVAMSIGAAPAMETLINQHPKWFGKIDRLWLDYYQAGILIRNGESSNNPDTIQSGVDKLNKLQVKIPKDYELYQRVEYDRFYGLTLLQDDKAAKPLAEKIAQQSDLPPYIQKALADYYLYTENSLASIALYEGLLQANPNDNKVKERLFYAYSDSERFSDAKQLVSTWHQAIPSQKWDFTGSARITNDIYVQTSMFSALIAAWRGEFADAEQKALDDLSLAPANPYLWITLGEIHLWQGWHDKAEEDFIKAGQFIPETNQVMVDRGLFTAKLEKGQWQGLSDEMANMESRYREPEIRAIKKLWRQANAPVWQASYRRGKTDDSGNTSVQASRDWNYDTILYSPRFWDGQRFFVRDQMQFADFEENNLYARYSGLGAELNYYPFSFIVEAGAGSRLNDKEYGWLGVNYRISDFLSTALRYKYNSNNTPLRALFDNTNADEGDLTVSYRFTEKWNTGLTANRMDFSDSNLRHIYSGWLNGELWRSDKYLLQGTLSGAFSDNKELDVSYFNPLSDRNFALMFKQTYHMFLNNACSFAQILETGGNSYWQERFGSDSGWDINYSHRWNWKKKLIINYGYGRRKSIYDGEGEYSNYIFTNVAVRFF